MNALLTQFVTESRDLVEQSSSALLALEQSPDDATHLDALFRAVHTVKGASGLFEMPPFTQAVHSGEDVLDAVRMGEVPFTPDLADLLLEMLDHVSDWLSELESTEALAPGAETISSGLASRLRAHLDAPEPEVPVADAAPAAADDGNMLQEIVYQPQPHAFYSGDDPLRTVLTTPGLLRVDPIPPDNWTPDGDFDPFQAVLGFAALSDADADTLRAHYQYVEDQITLTAVPAPAEAAAPPAPEPDPEAEMACTIIASQRRLIAHDGSPVPVATRLTSAREVLSRISDASGQAELAQELRALDPTAEGTFDQLDALADRLTTVLTAPQPEPQAAPSAEPKPEPQAAPEPEPAPDSASGPAPAPQAEPDRTDPAPHKATAIRVDADRIDLLMNLAGELVVAKNALPYLARRAEETDNAKSLAREIKAQHDVINRIADELQGAVMRIRMVPVGTVLGRFNRLVRDLSRKLEKRIRLEISGEETEADKAVVEELADPMVHLIRNALDHGLEQPADRRAAGKPEEGVIQISAYQRDESVVIEISDDGRGIDVARVKEKALSRGLVDPQAAEAMSDDDALQLILLPGLSTKDQTTDLSGRGVGMDVVASLVRRLGGTISLQSTLGEGTKVRLTLPLSMAVQHLMMIEVDNGLYGVPIDAVIESQRRPTSAIHRHRNEEMILLRERMIPLLRLRSLFGCAPGPDAEEINVLVVDVDGNEVGLIVDRFHAGVDAIVKPMEGLLAGVDCYSGTALLGDGSVLLALNLSEVIACRWN